MEETQGGVWADESLGLGVFFQTVFPSYSIVEKHC